MCGYMVPLIYTNICLYCASLPEQFYISGGSRSSLRGRRIMNLLLIFSVTRAARLINLFSIMVLASKDYGNKITEIKRLLCHIPFRNYSLMLPLDPSGTDALPLYRDQEKCFFLKFSKCIMFPMFYSELSG